MPETPKLNAVERQELEGDIPKLIPAERLERDLPEFGPTRGPVKEESKAEEKEKPQAASVEGLIAASPECNDWIEVAGEFAFSHATNLTDDRRMTFQDFMRKGPGMRRVDFIKGISSYISEMFPGADPFDSMFQKYQMELITQEMNVGADLGDMNLKPEEHEEAMVLMEHIQRSRENLRGMERALKAMRRAVDAEKKANLL